MLFRPTSTSYSLFNTTMLCKGKKQLAETTLRARICPLHFKFMQHFSGSYALIQVFCFCSTNFTWFNSIIKYKNLSTNKYVWFNKTFSLYLTKLFIVKKMATFIQPSLYISYTIHTETKILSGRTSLALDSLP